MNILIAIISVLGTAGGIILASALDVGNAVKTLIVTVIVLIAVYSMARIQPRATNPGKTAENGELRK